MATKNHKRSMSQPERAFWREAFLRPHGQYDNHGNLLPLDVQVKNRADFADLAVEEYRKRVTWRQP